jgi:spoIIIJ-associated protein
MTESHEFYALTVEEAVDKAAATLGVDRESLQFEVVDEGSTGFLGIGARDARISVRSTAPVSDDMVVGDGPPDEVEASGKTSVAAGPDLAPSESPSGSDEVQEAPVELILAADRFATDLIEAMGFDGMVDAYDAEEVIQVDFATGQTGLLIGQKGETIDAVQYLLNLAVYKDRPFIKRIVADTEGYRQRRVEAIQGMAHRTARRAQREKRPLSLPPMSAAERRVVHVYLKENPSVSTASEGQDEDRRVVVSPN